MATVCTVIFVWFVILPHFTCINPCVHVHIIGRCFKWTYACMHADQWVYVCCVKTSNGSSALTKGAEIVGQFVVVPPGLG